MKSIIKVIPSTSITTTTTTIAKFPISDYENFDVNIRCSSSTGMNYSLLTSPIDETAFYLSQTGGIVTAGACATKRNVFTNNCENFMSIVASATGTVSASNVRIIVSTIERKS